MRGLHKRIVEKAKSLAKNIAFSTPVRALARKVIATDSGWLRKLLVRNGYEDKVKMLATETIPTGLYFGKLTFNSWKEFDGQPFLLSESGTTVYGNTIEAPQRGFPLVYRNFVVSTTDPKQYKLSIPAEYRLQFSRIPFTTEQQKAYDTKYQVQQRGDFYFSLRGNLENPRKLIVTFPGFGPSTSRISYAITYLQQLSSNDLRDAAILCLQDRYGASGTYMVTDTAGRELGTRLHKFLTDVSNDLGIQNNDMLFFGASKGGSIALFAAERFPNSTLVIAVPQLDLPYYAS